MKNSTTLFLFFISIVSAAQKPVPVVRDTVAQWYATSTKVIDLSPTAGAPSLKKWCLDKIRNEGITAYNFATVRKTVPSYSFYRPSLTTPGWLKGMGIERAPAKSLKEWYFFDKDLPKENLERYRYRVSDKQFSADSCCGCDDADAFLVQQLLNYRNGKFTIHDLFISPLCARKTGNDSIGWYQLCDLAYNGWGYREFPGKSKDVVLLNSDVVEYDFNKESPSLSDAVSNPYNTDIGSLIYQDLLKGKLKAIDVMSGKAIAVKNLLTLHLPADTMAVYSDDDENISSYKVLQQERSPAEFSRLRITQDLYFDFKYERLYSVIRSVVIVLPVRSYDGTLRGYSPFFRLE